MAVTGSSGLIGTALVDALAAEGHRVRRLVRSEPGSDAAPGPDEVRWYPAAGTVDTEALAGVDAVVHLAGEGIAEKRWTEVQKGRIRTSRTQGTGAIARAMAELDPRPTVLLSGSAIGYYGNGGDRELTEDSPKGTGFLADVVQDWEAAAEPARHVGIRVVHLRSGVVLSSEGGALAKQLPIFKFGLGGRMGSGRQWLPWISLEDEVGAIRHLLTADVIGPVNLTAPNPVTNATFAKVLGSVLGRPSRLPIPSFGPKLLLGSELAGQVLFSSARVLPARLEASGFRFAHRRIEEALRAVLGRAA